MWSGCIPLVLDKIRATLLKGGEVSEIKSQKSKSVGYRDTEIAVCSNLNKHIDIKITYITEKHNVTHAL